MKTKNLAGGKAFTIDDPSVKLVTMIGSSFFNEPKYYNNDDKLQDDGSVTSQSQDIITIAKDIANSDNPKDLLAIAAWARQELNIRTTPQILLAIAANEVKTKEFVRNYVPRIVLRVDELKEVVSAFNLITYGTTNITTIPTRKSLPNSLKRGLADAAKKFNEVQYLKYNTTEHPTFGDVFQIIERKKNEPISHALFSFLAFGEVPAGEESDVPVVMARKELAKFTELTPEAQELARTSGATWEVLLSQFGNKPEVWETVIPQMGYMALLRNLRNIFAAKVSDATMTNVLKRISNKDEVLKSKQLPFRFFAAAKMIKEAELEGARTKKITDALNKALEHSTSNIPDVPGKTAIFLDVSGSMSSPVSGRSKINCYEAGAVLTALLNRVSDKAYVYTFATEVEEIKIKKDDTLLEAIDKLTNNNGGGTEAWRTVAQLKADKLNVDRIVLLSDMQCYHEQFETRERSVDGGLNAYKKAINPDVFFHSFDLAGYGTAQVDGTENTNLVSGFSEKIINSILSAEGVNKDAVTTIEDIRTRF